MSDTFELPDECEFPDACCSYGGCTKQNSECGGDALHDFVTHAAGCDADRTVDGPHCADRRLRSIYDWLKVEAAAVGVAGMYGCPFTPEYFREQGEGRLLARIMERFDCELTEQPPK